ncbi:hypothetical protein [Arthrobacter sp. C9C5]|uniref:hypothetical protein n=1 Tax=Arthrobacter sp. C9C5 TaxID=2735267 RepID=UPI001584C23E|nr:hypothetical protein [Arthrobacter sp. C9C5]NUU30710.1 hypothetical protein [Arthrobacter sp. C9C5]
MNEQSNGQLHAPSRTEGQTGPAQSNGRGEQPRFTVDKPNSKNNEAVLGPFTVRDLTVFGSTLVLFIASLIPMFAERYNLWNLGSLFFLGLGVLLPVIVAALFVARRVSPGTKIRIGSLSIDQFASVVASFSLAFFFLATAGAFVPSLLLGLVGALGLFTATVLARLIPSLAGDFLHRAEVPAHVVAREAAEPVRKPRAPKAASEAKAPKEGGSALAGWAKRIAPGKQAGEAKATPQAHEAQKASAGAAAGAGAAAAYTRPAAAEPATQAHGVVPSASPSPTAAASPTPTAAYAPSAAGEAVPSAAEQTPTAMAPAASAPAEPPVASPAPAEQGAGLEATQAASVPVAASAAAPSAASHEAPTALTPQVRSQEPIGATVDPTSRPQSEAAQPAYEAFWFAVAQPRTAVDERSGAPAFVVEPGGWVLALEDRGHEFLVQHTDGRVGVLRDLSNIERG